MATAIVFHQLFPRYDIRAIGMIPARIDRWTGTWVLATQSNAPQALTLLSQWLAGATAFAAIVAAFRLGRRWLIALLVVATMTAAVLTWPQFRDTFKHVDAMSGVAGSLKVQKWEPDPTTSK